MKLNSILLVIALIVFAVPALAETFNEEWVELYDSGTGAQDFVQAIGLDANANVYVTGYADNGSSYDFLTIKYDTAGDRKWAVTKDGPSNSYDTANDIAVDSLGNVYVTGNTIDVSWDYYTIKYDTDGNEIWAKLYDGTGNDFDQSLAIALDAAGNAYVTGISSNGTNNDCVTVKYRAADGNEEWAQRYNGTANLTDQGRAIFVDSVGNVYVTGSTTTGPYTDILTIKYDTDGNEVWAMTYNRTDDKNDIGFDIAPDANGDVYVTGRAENTEKWSDVVTIKYSGTDGNEEWVSLYGGPDNRNDEGRAIVLDATGNVYVTGYFSNANNRRSCLTIKYNTSNGNEEWAAIYETANNDGGEAIALDAANNVIVAGYTDPNSQYGDALVVKYDTAGNELWAMTYDGGVSRYDAYYDVALDSDGNVYATGYKRNTNDRDDALTVKYSCGGCIYEGLCYDYGDRQPDDDCMECSAMANQFTVVIPGSSCDDDLFCTTGETCQLEGNICGGGSFTCPSGWFCSEEAQQCFEDEQTPIELISFEAEGLDEAVLLTWETATEKDNAGFNLYRSLTATGDYLKVTSSMLPAEGNAFTGASYEFVDGDVAAGTYFYKLEDVSIYGVSTFHGPIEITIETEEPQFGCGMF